MGADADGRWTVRGQACSASIFRFSLFGRGQSPGSALNRYGFLKDDWDSADAREASDGDTVTLKTQKAVFSFEKGEQTTMVLRDKEGNMVLEGKARALPEGGFVTEFGLSKNEMLFGLGDQTRERIEHRGTKANMHIVNVATYIPISFLMSTRGYGILVNTTFSHVWDMGASDKRKLALYVPDRNLDIYFFHAADLKGLLAAYTELAGRPVLPPKWSFGLWFICRQQADDFQVISDALNFRDRNIPCDVIGLEPGWMDKDYDFSVEKQWSRERFPIPTYRADNFYNALKRLGYKLELWLCNDYDLSYEAERRLGNKPQPRVKAPGGFLEDDTEKDLHFTEPVRLDPYTKPDEPWFEHLKRFVDQGADLFKQDGSMQVCDHPDRLWGNGMADEEMHNLYPLLYSQQMYEGFKEHTGRRPCCYTPAGWAGLQRHAGTWTGDTGGGPKTLVACLNLALAGHSLVTCDMQVTTKEGIHYGFLLPWSVVVSWNYFLHPWLLGDGLYSIFCDYARLRSRLIPYLYTYAHVAHTTGLPMIRPLMLEFPHDPKAPNILTQWFLGREFMAGSFSDNVYLPEGKWYDYWTGKAYVGPKTIKYRPPDNRGGALFVRANSIVPLGPLVQYTGQKTDEGMTLQIFVECDAKAEFRLYDDDGVTFDYEDGKFSLSRIRAEFCGGVLKIKAPKKLKVQRITARLEKKPRSVSLNGREVSCDWSQQDKNLEITPVNP